jgi:hypothetical protein
MHKALCRNDVAFESNPSFAQIRFSPVFWRADEKNEVATPDSSLHELRKLISGGRIPDIKHYLYVIRHQPFAQVGDPCFVSVVFPCIRNKHRRSVESCFGGQIDAAELGHVPTNVFRDQRLPDISTMPVAQGWKEVLELSGANSAPAYSNKSPHLLVAQLRLRTEATARPLDRAESDHAEGVHEQTFQNARIGPRTNQRRS